MYVIQLSLIKGDHHFFRHKKFLYEEADTYEELVKLYKDFRTRFFDTVEIKVFKEESFPLSAELDAAVFEKQKKEALLLGRLHKLGQLDLLFTVGSKMTFEEFYEYVESLPVKQT